MKKNLKRWLGVFLAVVMVVTSVYVSDRNVKAETTSAIPSDVEFKSVADLTNSLTTTLGANVSGATSASLGTVSDTTIGFTFDVNKLSTSTDGYFRVGVYNATANNVCDNGYIIFIHNGADGKVRFQLRGGSGEVDYGLMTDVSCPTDTITVHVWNKDNTMNLAVNEQIILTHDSSSITLGTHMNAYNEWTEEVRLTGTQIPQNVNFQSVVNTTGNLTTTLGAKVDSGTSAALGNVTDIATGFTFTVNKLSASTGGILKLGVYNTSSNNAWSNGCLVYIHNADDGNVLFQLVEDGGWIPKSVAIEGDIITVHVWNANNTMYLAANGLIVCTYDTSSVELGTYMNVYNEWTEDVVLSAPTVPSDVTFQSVTDLTGDLTTTLAANSATSTNFGQIASVSTGFTFSLNKPTDGMLKIGLYNNSSNNVWDGGYMLFVHSGNAGKIRFQLRGTGEADLGLSTDIAISSDLMKVHAWYQNNTMYVAVNGTIILSHRGTTYQLGSYMSAYNTWIIDAVFSGTELPDDVTFENVADTAQQEFTRLDAFESSPAPQAALGQVTDTATGFTFELNKLQTTTNGILKIGLYNNSANNPWDGGYMLFVHNGVDGKVRFQLRGGADEKDLSLMTDETVAGDTMTIHAWYKDNVMYIALDEIIILQHTNTDGLAIGTYMNVCSEWTEEVVIKRLPSQLPSDVTFVNVAEVTGNETTTISAKTGDTATQAALGQVADTAIGFTFDVNKLSTSTGGYLKVGVYNTSENNVWSNGYIIFVHNGADGMVRFQLRGGSDEAELNLTTDVAVAGDTITVHAWNANNTMYLAVNEQIILTHDSSSMTLGTYMNICNGWTEDAVFSGTLPETEMTSQIPLDVTFKNVAETNDAESTTVAASSQVALGVVKDSSVGFTFDLANSVPGGILKVGVYNTSANPWDNGYMIFIHTGDAGKIRFQLRNANDQTDLGLSADVAISGDTITVHTWFKDGTMYLAVNEQIVLKHENSTLTLGNYMNVYNEWTTAAVLTGVLAEVVISTYEDIFDTSEKDKVILNAEKSATLGAVEQLENIFIMKVKTTTSADNWKDLKLGMYNTNAGTNVWASSGYIFFIRPTGTDGEYKFWLGKNDQSAIQYSDSEPYVISGLNQDYMTIKSWITNVNTVTGAHVLHIAVNETEVITYTNNGSLAVGKNMCVYNCWANAEIISVFEDLGETAELNSTTLATTDWADLGSVSSMEKGFRFKVGYKEQTEGTRLLKIGLYNTDNCDPWANGYVLWLQAKDPFGTLGWGVHTKAAGSSATEVEGYAPAWADVTGFAEGDVEFFVWLTEVDEEAGTHVFHLAMNGEEIATWRNDGSDTNADGLRPTDVYMSAYNESWNNGATISTFYQPDIDFNIKGINDNTAYDTTNSVWKIYLNTDGNIPDGSYSWKVSVDGTEYDITLVKEAISETSGASNLVYFTIPSSVIPQSPAKDYAVVLKAMTTSASDDRGAYSVTLENAYTLYVQKGGHVLDTALAYVTDSDVVGDCNGDGVSNSLDLLQLMKYTRNEALVNESADLTNVIGDDANAEDINALRRVLTLSDTEKALGSAQDVDGYVAYGMPSYDEDEVMRIGAYDGPRSADGTNYSMTWNKEYDWNTSTSSVLGSSHYYATIDSVTGTTVEQDFINDYEFKQFAEAGFNTVVSESDASYSSEGHSIEEFEKYLDLADKYNVNVIMQASKVSGYLWQEDNAASTTEVKKEVAEMIDLFSAHKSFIGIQMGDEIPAAGTNGEAVAADYLLLSNYIKKDLGRDDLLLYTSNPAADDDLSTLMKKVGTINDTYEFSVYPLMREWVDVTDISASNINLGNAFEKNTDEEQWFSYLSSTAVEAKSQGVNHMGTILQSAGYVHPYNLYGSWNNPSCRRGIESLADVGYQVNTALAYGSKSLTYFTYWEHFSSSENEFFTDSIVRYPEGDEDPTKSVKTAAYDYVKTVNNQVLNYDHVLMDYEWKGTVVLGSVSGADTSYTVDSNSRLANAGITTGKALVGCMKDSEGFDGYMIANAEDPLNGDADNKTQVTLTFNKASRAIVYENGEKKIVPLTNGAYTFTVGVGEGVFVIPLV